MVVVREGRLELPLCLQSWILSPVRLPIPPLSPMPCGTRINGKINMMGMPCQGVSGLKTWRLGARCRWSVRGTVGVVVIEGVWGTRKTRLRLRQRTRRGKGSDQGFSGSKSGSGSKSCFCWPARIKHRASSPAADRRGWIIKQMLVITAIEPLRDRRNGATL